MITRKFVTQDFNFNLVFVLDTMISGTIPTDSHLMFVTMTNSDTLQLTVDDTRIVSMSHYICNVLVLQRAHII